MGGKDIGKLAAPLKRMLEKICLGEGQQKLRDEVKEISGEAIICTLTAFHPSLPPSCPYAQVLWVVLTLFGSAGI